jgi:hypothetical protein
MAPVWQNVVPRRQLDPCDFAGHRLGSFVPAFGQRHGRQRK